MGENQAEATCVVAPAKTGTTNGNEQPPLPPTQPWMYNYFEMYQQQNQQQFNAYRAHVQQYAMQQMQNASQQNTPVKPNNAPPGFGNSVVPPTLMDLQVNPPSPPSFSISPGNLSTRPSYFNGNSQQQQQSNQKPSNQFGGIRFNLNNQQKRIQNVNPLFANPSPAQTNGQQQNNGDNNNGNSKRKRKRKKNKQNAQAHNNSLATGLPLPDMSIPPPTFVSGLQPPVAPDLSKPPPPFPTVFPVQTSPLLSHDPIQQSPQTPTQQQQPKPQISQTLNSSLKKPDPFNNPTDAWPESLNNYVARCYAKCKTNFDKDQIDICLKGRITAAANRGELWTKDWDSEPIPSVHSERNVLVAKPPVQGQLSKFQNTSTTPPTTAQKKGISESLGLRLGTRTANGSKRSSRSRSRSPYASKKRRGSSRSSSSGSDSPRRKSHRSSDSVSSDENYKSFSKTPKNNKMAQRLGQHSSSNTSLNSKKKNKKKNKKAAFYSEHSKIGGDVIGDAARLKQRAARFNDSSTKKQANVSSTMSNKKKKILMPTPNRLFVDDSSENNFDLTDFHIVGTCRDLEKSFLRLTKAPAATEVRPVEVLVFSLSNVKKKWVEKQDYFYACDQLKSIRQDLTVSDQNLE